MTDRYILDDDGTPVIEPDLFKWGRWFEHADRIINRTMVEDVRVSTLFLGLDQSSEFGGDSPILFETRIFGGPHDQYQEQYATRDEALAGHQRAVELASKP